MISTLFIAASSIGSLILRTVFPLGGEIMLGCTLVFLFGCGRRTVPADKSN
jgi:hypothetical protein